MIKRLLILSFVILVIQGNAQQVFDFKDGDLLFQMGKGSAFEQAIASVTSGMDSLDFSHVGVACFENDSLVVLEATPDFGVVKTPVKDFIEESAVIVVGRLKQQCQYAIPEALEFMKTLLGKPYDFTFHHDNDAYYCSELIQTAFKQSDGVPVFESVPLTFKDENTGKVHPYWIEYYKKYDEPIPEGAPGSSPAGLSRSDALELIFRMDVAH